MGGASMTEKIIVRVDQDLKAIVSKYLDVQRREITGFTSLLADQRFEEIRKAAHKIKGSGATFGFNYLTEAATRIEKEARNGNAEPIEELSCKLIEYLDHIELEFVPEEELYG
jgi:histidine phosphotransfer protein HptB